MTASQHTRKLRAVPPTPSNGTKKSAELASHPDKDRLADGHMATDIGNSYRFIDYVDGRARYVDRWNKWIVYRNGVWHIDPNEAVVTEAAKVVARRIRRYAREHDIEPSAKQRLKSWGMKSATAGRVAAMIKLARGDERVLIQHDELDTHPYLLNVLNGTIDLRTGRMRAHSKEDLLTMQAPVRFNRGAKAPLWKECLNRWQPDSVMRRYLQLVIGSAACGYPVEHLFINYGTGANGKSKFYGAVMYVLGEYAVVPDKSLFIQTRHEPHETVKATLFRARMLLAPETERVAVIAEAQVKELTGSDAIKCRRMREDEWRFMPTHTAFMHTNYRPSIKGTDEGIWRRVRLVPWLVCIPESERDETLAQQLQAEAAGILNWIVAGAVTWLDGGQKVKEPEVVRTATDSYRQEEDVVGRFLNEMCVRQPAAQVLVSHMRLQYEAWCEQNGLNPVSGKAFAMELSARGARQKGSGAYRKWQGVTLK